MKSYNENIFFKTNLPLFNGPLQSKVISPHPSRLLPLFLPQPPFKGIYVSQEEARRGHTAASRHPPRRAERILAESAESAFFHKIMPIFGHKLLGDFYLYFKLPHGSTHPPGAFYKYI